MKKKIILICSLASSLAYSQVGVNTANPQAAFHVDGGKDNPATGAPSAAQQTNDFAVTPTGAVGIGTTVPTNTLDVNGTARIRTINQAASGTVTTSLYVDPTGVLVKSSGSSTYGEVRSNSAAIATLADTPYLTGIPAGIYKLTVTCTNACGDSTSANFLVHCNAANGYFGLIGLNGFVSSGFSTPSFNHTAKNKVYLTWSGVVACADGGNANGFNYGVNMPDAATINIFNNRPVTRNFKVTLTRND
ncbi:hypothetical protein CQ046_06550 [Chryseobacterium sp. MYb7]|uniref:hypothetical protein n=1 Tax=Chryseobacterium sp. MYb7 TaxID=1827290 RepID=UPI000D0028E1|nr:hypothetical protein [Chryseobacterium sp. MYb7]PRB04930.1 hypothetical protein CQ046_06550 [Chryseobacterium sp. MYb7]